MNGEYAVVQILLATSGVSDIVATKVYLDEAPQGEELPYVIVSEDDVEPFDTKSGVSAKDHDRIRVFPYEISKNKLRLLAQACRNALDRKEAGTYGTYQVEFLRFVSQNTFDEEINNRKVFAKDQEYMVRVIQ